MDIHASLRAEDIAHLGPIPITNSMVMAWATMLALGIFAYRAGRRPQLVPRGAQNAFEFMLEALLTLTENTAGHYARRIFPLIATLFIYIVTANYMGLLPGVGTIHVANPNAHSADSAHAAAGPGDHAFVPVAEAGSSAAAAGPPAAGQEAKQEAKPGAKQERHEPAQVPLLRAANADVNMTLGMALIAFLFIHASGVIVHKVSGYWKELSTPLLMTPIKITIECFVPVSLSMRLFGNIFGGEMLLAVMGFPIVAIPFMVMELLFGLIQAVIFSMLTLIFTSLAVHIPPGHEGHEGHEGQEDRAGKAGHVGHVGHAGREAVHAYSGSV